MLEKETKATLSLPLCSLKAVRGKVEAYFDNLQLRVMTKFFDQTFVTRACQPQRRVTLSRFMSELQDISRLVPSQVVVYHI